MMAPVVRELEARGIECVVMALTTGYRKAIQLGLHRSGIETSRGSYPSPSGYCNGGANSLVRTRTPMWQKRRACGTWASTLPNGSASKEKWPRASGMRQWVGGHFYPVDFMTAVLRDVAPAIVLTTNTPRSEGAALEAASRLGIPSVSMVDLFLQPNDEFCRRKHHPDRITVIAPSVKGALVASGLSPDRIVVTGNPAFDTLRDPAVQRQAQEAAAAMGLGRASASFSLRGTRKASIRPSCHPAGVDRVFALKCGNGCCNGYTHIQMMPCCYGNIQVSPSLSCIASAPQTAYQ